MTNPTDTGPGGSTTETTTPKKTSSGNVKLSLPYPNDVFQYGPDENKHIIKGRKGIVLSKDDADKIKKLAELSGVQLLEEEAE